MSLLGCILKCSSGDTSCQSGCSGSAASDVSASIAAANYSACAIVQCMADCVPGSTGLLGTGGSGSGGATNDSTSSVPRGGDATTSTPGNGGASPGSGGSTSVASTSASGGITARGGSSSAVGGTSAASATGGSTSSSATGGAAGASTGAAPVSGINWLTFEEDWADVTMEPNRSFNISGVVYAYADSCATMTWDPINRCISGTLCTPGASYQNWGVAIGFDFHNTGETGTPANAKLAWDPAAVNARGVAWQLSGSAPGLELWVLQMDPKWAGTCTADSCEIAGPPYGYGPIGSTESGSMSFTSTASWYHDDWGGSGTVYSPKLADTVSLQFKLPAIVAGGQSYKLCISRLGIIY
ncbi:MAG TPA: hypothetical protein VIV60_08090 [Polyangiaceae bacterium]